MLDRPLAVGPLCRLVQLLAPGHGPAVQAHQAHLAQWIGRTLGPWARAPRLTGALRTALRVTIRGDAYLARVVR